MGDDKARIAAGDDSDRRAMLYLRIGGGEGEELAPAVVGGKKKNKVMHGDMGLREWDSRPRITKSPSKSPGTAEQWAVTSEDVARRLCVSGVCLGLSPAQSVRRPQSGGPEKAVGGPSHPERGEFEK